MPDEQRIKRDNPEFYDEVMGRQVGGDHYKTCGIQPVDYITANDLDYLEGNVVKYITRHRVKGGRKDIEKVIHYAQMILANEYNISEQRDSDEAIDWKDNNNQDISDVALRGLMSNF